MSLVSLFIVSLIVGNLSQALGFSNLSRMKNCKMDSYSMSSCKLTPTAMLPPSIQDFSLILSDTSINDEEVLAVTGTASNLPDPSSIVGVAAIILLGVAALQFSLGDLTKEEGNAMPYAACLNLH